MLSSLHYFTWSSQLPSSLHFTGGEADRVRTGGPLKVSELGGGTAVLGAQPTPHSALPPDTDERGSRADAHLHMAPECPVTHGTPTSGLKGPRQQGEWQLCAGRPSGRKASVKQEVVLIPVSCHGTQSRRPHGTTFRNHCEHHCSSAHNDNVALCRRGSTVSTGGPVMPGASSCKGFL